MTNDDDAIKGQIETMTPEQQASEVNAWLDRHRLRFTDLGIDGEAWAVAVLSHAIITAQKLYGPDGVNEWLSKYINATTYASTPKH